MQCELEESSIWCDASMPSAMAYHVPSPAPWLSGLACFSDEEKWWFCSLGSCKRQPSVSCVQPNWTWKILTWIAKGENFSFYVILLFINNFICFLLQSYLFRSGNLITLRKQTFVLILQTLQKWTLMTTTYI